MFKVIWKAMRTGVVTQDVLVPPPPRPARFRGRPEIDSARCDGCADCVAACPTRVIRVDRSLDGAPRRLTLDLAGCIACGECVPACKAGAFRMTHDYLLASRDRDTLLMEVRFAADAPPASASPAPTPSTLPLPSSLPSSLPASSAASPEPVRCAPRQLPSIELVGGILREKIGAIFGRSLHIREVSAGDCNACDLEVQAINNPIFDASRFGIHFVASPRYADMLLVTGPVSRNMAGPLMEAYNACPQPRLVVAVGACACAGGIFASSAMTMGGVDALIPVNTYIPGCPPPPQAILHGLLMTIERAAPQIAKIIHRPRPSTLPAAAPAPPRL